MHIHRNVLSPLKEAYACGSGLASHLAVTISTGWSEAGFLLANRLWKASYSCRIGLAANLPLAASFPSTCGRSLIQPSATFHGRLKTHWALALAACLATAGWDRLRRSGVLFVRPASMMLGSILKKGKGCNQHRSQSRAVPMAQIRRADATGHGEPSICK